MGDLFKPHPKTKSDKLTDFLRDKRRERGYTLRRFATQIGVTPTELSKLERGDLSPNIEEIMSIGEFLEVDFLKLSNAFIAREFGEDIDV